MKHKLAEFAQYNRKNATKEESRLWYRFLRKYPCRFRRQLAVGGYILDFFCHQAMLAVELDGSQHFEPEAERQDALRTADLESRGIKVLRFSNADVSGNFEGVCQAIDLAVKDRLRTLPPIHPFSKK